MTDEAPVDGSDHEVERRTVPAVAFVVAVMVAAVLGILAVALLATDGDDGSGERDEARLAAGRFGERFLTFRHDELDQWKADVLALSTGGFAGEVEEVEAGLRRLIGEAEIDAETQVTEIFLGDVDSGTASAVLLYDRDVASADGTRTETDRYMQLELNMVDGDWLVDNVIDIATAGGGGLAPTPEPATTAPSTPEEPSDTTAPDG